MAFDSVVWPTDQSFFGSYSPLNQTYTQSYITPQSPQLVIAGDEWLKDFDLSLNYEPLGAMTKEADNQCHSRGHEFVDYLDSTAFLSAQPMQAFSPKTSDAKHFECELDFAAKELTIDTTLIDTTLIDTTLIEMSEEKPKRRQTKRMATKRSEKSVKSEKNNRKREQNKSAANRYRMQKRAQLEAIRDLHSRYSEDNDTLRAQLQKLQLEFNEMLPLAKAAFAADTHKCLELEMMAIRVLIHNLLD